jgi:hypothetical protein
MTNFHQIRNSSSTEQKLFETALSSCISGIQKFTVSKPKPRTVTAASTPWTFTVAQSVDTPPKAEGTPWKRDFTEDSGTGKLAEPFISPHSKGEARPSDTLSRSPLEPLTDILKQIWRGTLNQEFATVRPLFGSLSLFPAHSLPQVCAPLEYRKHVGSLMTDPHP